MKTNKKLIAGILVLSSILMGTGYAYWADSLTIDTKATTGELEVKFIDLGLYKQYNVDLPEGATGSGYWSLIDGVDRTGNDGYIESDFFERGKSNYNSIAAEGSIKKYTDSVKGINSIEFNAVMTGNETLDKDIGPYKAANKLRVSDKIELTIKNMYPGYAQAFRTDIVNVGNIAAKLSAIETDIKDKDGNPLDNDRHTKDLLGVALLVEREYQNGNEVVDVFKAAASMEGIDVTDADFFDMGGVKFIRLASLEKMNGKNLTNNLLYITPNKNRMDAYIGIAMDPDPDGNFTAGTAAKLYNKDTNPENMNTIDELSQNDEANIEIRFLWDQFNEGKDVDASNILIEQNPEAN